MDYQMAYLHRDWRCNLRKHFKENGGELDLNMAKQYPHPEVRNKDDWDWLCE